MPSLAAHIEFQLIRILIRDPPCLDQMFGLRAQRAIRCAIQKSLPNLSGNADPIVTILLEQLEIVIGGNPGIHHDCRSIVRIATSMNLLKAFQRGLNRFGWPLSHFRPQFWISGVEGDSKIVRYLI